jgi:hypothetical protein
MDVDEIGRRSPTGISMECPICDGRIRPGDEHCPSCRRTLTSGERFALHGGRAAESQVMRAIGPVAHGRFGLVVAAVLVSVHGFIYGGMLHSHAIIGCGSILTCLLVGLFFVAARYPLAALSAGLCAYIGMEILLALTSPLNLGQNMFSKLLILLALTGGIGTTVAMRRLARRR